LLGFSTTSHVPQNFLKKRTKKRNEGQIKTKKKKEIKKRKEMYSRCASSTKITLFVCRCFFCGVFLFVDVPSYPFFG